MLRGTGVVGDGVGGDAQLLSVLPERDLLAWADSYREDIAASPDVARRAERDLLVDLLSRDVVNARRVGPNYGGDARGLDSRRREPTRHSRR
jgi:hypothetical protein